MKITLNDTTEFKPKKAKGLIQIPKLATLKMVIELLNDINITVVNDGDLDKKWKHWMPNG